MSENIAHKSHGLLFNEFSMRALVAGRKTQTRRPIKPPKWAFPETIKPSFVSGRVVAVRRDTMETDVIKPPARPGDLIWPRETWRVHSWADDLVYIEFKADGAVHLVDSAIADPGFYAEWQERVVEEARSAVGLSGRGVVDAHGHLRWEGESPISWKPGIHLPFCASREWRRLVDIRPERVQQISEADAMAEGVEFAACGIGPSGEPLKGYRTGFVRVWTDIHGIKGPFRWLNNPWVWRYELEKI